MLNYNEIAEYIVTNSTMTMEEVHKRDVTYPDETLLKPQQMEAYNRMKDFIKSDDEKLFCLQGFAGSGKTYCLSMLVEWFLASKMGRVAMTAPTNKAVKVMQSMAQYKHSQLSYITLHSLLGLREQIDGYGRQIFVQSSTDKCTASDYDLIIIDEASMVQDDLLVGGKYNMGLFSYAKMSNFKILFIGDPAQIPPVGKDMCIPMDEEKRKEYGIGFTELTEIVRQAADNPIIALSSEVRKALGRPEVLPIRENSFNEEDYSGVYFMDYEDKDAFFNSLDILFNSQQFKENSDFVKVLAWRNKTVNTLNKKIRKMLYGANTGKICIGEKLIVNKPVIDPESGAIKLTTNDEVSVDDLEVSTGNYVGVDLTIYKVRVKVKGTDKVHSFNIIHEDSEEDFELMKDYYREQALSAEKGTFEAVSRWKSYYALLEYFADVNYNYCITAHKSQGSTFENVFVIEGDIDFNNKVKERNRIKYTSFTRPSKRLFIMN